MIQRKIKDLGLRLEAERDYELASFDDADMIERAAEDYYRLGRRRGLMRDYAAAEMRRNGTLIGGHAGARGPGRRHAVRHVRALRHAT